MQSQFPYILHAISLHANTVYNAVPLKKRNKKKRNLGAMLFTQLQLFFRLYHVFYLALFCSLIPFRNSCLFSYPGSIISNGQWKIWRNTDERFQIIFTILVVVGILSVDSHLIPWILTIICIWDMSSVYHKRKHTMSI